ncbi:MAG: flavodoxin family protein [Negativicutes bacterium]|nr:flavodoxin family protein [Negativicutes bacterium]
MKVVALLASPRKQGNTALLMQEVLKETEALGAQTEVFYLNGMDIKGCQSCFACKSQSDCVIKDDGRQVLDALNEADCVVMATPVYMWDMTAQLKTIIDRLFCFLNPDYSSRLAPGKKVLWALTQGQPDKNTFLSTFEKHGKMLQFLGFGESKFLVAGGLRTPGDILSQQNILQNARDMAKWLVTAE